MPDFEVVELSVTFQALVWITAFVVSVVVTGKPHWQESSGALKLGVGLWNGSCVAQCVLLISTPQYEFLSWRFSWLYSIAPLMMACAGTVIIWFCNLALREQNVKNNRRSSVLLRPKNMATAGNSDRSMTSR